MGGGGQNVSAAIYALMVNSGRERKPRWLQSGAATLQSSWMHCRGWLLVLQSRPENLSGRKWSLMIMPAQTGSGARRPLWALPCMLVASAGHAHGTGSRRAAEMVPSAVIATSALKK